MDGKLNDTQKFSSEGGDLYIRLAHSELEKRNTKVLIIVPVVGGIITIAICAFILQRWMSKRNALKEKSKVLQVDKGEADTTASGENLNEVKLHDLPLFNFLKLANATNNFHSAKKLGQGGFGPVYKGKFRDGKEIAVKRLSKASRQGVEEFMNEILGWQGFSEANKIKPTLQELLGHLVTFFESSTLCMEIVE
ncbi:hypothetical protein LWI28_027739 [Acer negundo]|uniref:Protein kinase domain-containing protein n=1 Tax=Acer negundo TaxID=4023 RepID=A0AAD5JUL0_ACENE|nr:hypothetical protein LWI28_027739 [Acer negundo]